MVHDSYWVLVRLFGSIAMDFAKYFLRFLLKVLHESSLNRHVTWAAVATMYASFTFTFFLLHSFVKVFLIDLVSFFRYFGLAQRNFIQIWLYQNVILIFQFKSYCHFYWYLVNCFCFLLHIFWLWFENILHSISIPSKILCNFIWNPVS